MIYGQRSFLGWSMILAVLVAGVAYAQSGDGEIAGLVKDPSGAPIAGAMLSLVNQDTGVTRTTTSDADGRYRFGNIAPGRYSLKTEATGFKSENVTGFVFNIGTHVDRDMSLAVGSVQDAITVTGEVPPVDTSKGEVAGGVTKQENQKPPGDHTQDLKLPPPMPRNTQE